MRDTAESRAIEKQRIEALAALMKVRFSRDACGDWYIEGRRGNIHADGNGYSVAVMLDTARQWTAAKGKLAGFCEVRQDGDTEGVLYMHVLPTTARSVILREVVHVPKIREVSDEEKARLAAMSARFSTFRISKQVAPASHAAE